MSFEELCFTIAGFNHLHAIQGTLKGDLFILLTRVYERTVWGGVSQSGDPLLGLADYPI
jgi:hypothetical protein